MAYNSTGYNTVAYSVTRVFESGSTTATGLVNTTESTIALELGASASTTSLDTTETGIGSESGTTQSRGVVRLPTDTSYNVGAYNSGVYNTESGGEIALAFEDGVTETTGQLNGQESTTALEVGTTTSTGALDITDSGRGVESGTTTATGTPRAIDIGLAIESGLVESTGLLNATESTIPPIVRVYARDALLDIAYTLDLNTTFTLTRIIEFTESNTMTEIPEIDDTITNESRRLEFTAKEDGSVKDITSAEISWSLVDKDGVVLDETDAEVDITIIDAQNGRFNVEVDTFDTGAGVYRQRVEIEDSQGRISRSNGVYRLQEF